MSRRVELVLLHGSSASIPLHLERMISSYLGPAPNMTLSKTCTFGSIALLDWMWEASCTRASERTPWWSLANFLRSEPHYYRYQFAESMENAARRGDVAVVEWLLDHFQGCVVPGEAVEWAADNGHLHVLKLLWKYDRGRPHRESEDDKKRHVATRSGDVLAQISPGNHTVCWEAFSGLGVCHPDGLRWLCDHVPPKGGCELELAIEATVDNGDWELAKRLLPPGGCLLDYAESSTNPEMIEWMLDCGYLQRDEIGAGCAISHLAVSSENVPLMQRIADQHKPPYSVEWEVDWCEALEAACTKGQLKAFQWLVAHHTKRNEHLIDLPAVVLREPPAEVDFLQFLYEQRLFGDSVLPDAVKSGQPLEVLKWLLGHVPHPERLAEYCVMDIAAACGRLDMLRYFQSLDDVDSDLHPDVPLWCTTRAMDDAARNGHLEVVKWLHSNRSEGCTEAAMDTAAERGHLETVKWLHANTNAGCTTAAMDKAALGGFLEVIKWLHENTSAGCTTDAMDNAASRGHLKVLKRLYANTSEGCTVKAITNAVRSSHFGVASWLHEHFPEYIPAKLDSVIDFRPFEELLFREQHYGDIFTSHFLQELKDPSREVFDGAKGEAWSWAKEKYLGT